MYISFILCYFYDIYLVIFSSPEEIENLREKMSAETSLIIIGSADDSLRLSHNKKIFEGVTQSMVDRCIMVCFASKCKVYFMIKTTFTFRMKLLIM